MDIYRAHVLCCGGTGCTSSGSAQIIERFEQKIKEAGLEKEVKVVQHGLLWPVRGWPRCYRIPRRHLLLAA